MMDWMLSDPRKGCWAGMGMGKTSSTLHVLDILSLTAGDVFPALVLAPYRVAQSTWPDETKKWDGLQHLRVSPILGTAEQRAKALAAPADIYTINYENLVWLTEKCGKKWPFRTIVADEATKLKGFRIRQGGQRTKALGKVSWGDAVRYFFNLTGTPSPNGLIDLWGPTWFLDQGASLGRTFTAFKDRWFHTINNADGYPMTKPLAFAQEQIQERIAHLYYAFRPEDWFDLKEPIKSVVEVKLPAKAQRLYDELQKEAFAELKKGTVTAVSGAAKTGKLSQVANGAIYLDEQEGAWEEVHAAKLDALESVIEEAGGAPVLVAYHFKHDLERLKKRFPKARVLDKNKKTIDDWNAGKIQLLLAHPASAGHGLNLQDGGNILVFFTVDWDLELHLQIIERIGPVRQAQAGHDRPVYLYFLIAKGTVDELKLDRLESKRSVQDILMEAMKR
jgi:SNF2 family DNA or RNA helicase